MIKVLGGGRLVVFFLATFALMSCVETAGNTAADNPPEDYIYDYTSFDSCDYNDVPNSFPPKIDIALESVSVARVGCVDGTLGSISIYIAYLGHEARGYKYGFYFDPIVTNSGSVDVAHLQFDIYLGADYQKTFYQPNDDILYADPNLRDFWKVRGNRPVEEVFYSETLLESGKYYGTFRVLPAGTTGRMPYGAAGRVIANSIW